MDTQQNPRYLRAGCRRPARLCQGLEAGERPAGRRLLPDEFPGRTRPCRRHSSRHSAGVGGPDHRRPRAHFPVLLRLHPQHGRPGCQGRFRRARRDHVRRPLRAAARGRRRGADAASRHPCHLLPAHLLDERSLDARPLAGDFRRAACRARGLYRPADRGRGAAREHPAVQPEPSAPAQALRHAHGRQGVALGPPDPARCQVQHDHGQGGAHGTAGAAHLSHRAQPGSAALWRAGCIFPAISAKPRNPKSST